MSIEQAVLENLQQLSPSQQQELLDFSEFLKQKNVNLTPQERLEKWRKVIEKLPQTSVNLSDEVLHREAMYEDVSSSKKQDFEQPKSCYDLALALGVIGVAEGLPTDLSTSMFI